MTAGLGERMVDLLSHLEWEWDDVREEPEKNGFALFRAHARRLKLLWRAMPTERWAWLGTVTPRMVTPLSPKTGCRGPAGPKVFPLGRFREPFSAFSFIIFSPSLSLLDIQLPVFSSEGFTTL